MPKYRKKPVVIDAVQLTGFDDKDAIAAHFGEFKNWHFTDTGLAIVTLEGTMAADIGDFIIKGVKGEFYPCKPEIFLATYEPA